MQRTAGHRTHGPTTIAAVALSLLSLVGTLALLAAPTSAVPASSAGSAHPDFARASIVPLASPTCSTTSLCVSTVLTAYQFGPLLINATMNGTGQSIAIVDACGDSNLATDVAAFDAAMGLGPINLSIFQPQGTPCSDPTGWGVETALDVEWAHAMAPGATINLIAAASSSTANLYGAWNYTLSHHLGNAISNSWGGSGGCPTIARTALATAGTQHVTVLASSGDSGRWGSGTLFGVQQPADCQTVLTVGGTHLKVVNVSGAYSSESAWSGSGGGYVTGAGEPAYQKKANITDSFAVLGKPDVSAVADPGTGVWIFDQSAGGWLVVGGTSVSCPIWAGFVADVNSWRAANGFAALGPVDMFLYNSVYGVNHGSANYPVTIHDVTSGSNGWSAGTGWDAATGVGSFRGYPLANLLAHSPKA
ncbi:MAG TPA: S53 family peptidase [Thermoplasmata archaeon]